MTCVINNTARQYNLKCIGPRDNRVLVRLVPGFNNVEDEHWKAFQKGTHVDPYVKTLLDGNLITVGEKADEKEVEQDPKVNLKSKSKSEKLPPNFRKKVSRD